MANPTPSPSASLQVVSLTIFGLEEPLAAGTTASLRAIARMSDGSDVTISDGAQWASQDPDVAQIDGRGTLAAVREGQTRISVGVKGAVAAATATVVMNVAGTWTVTFVPISCPHFSIPGCAGARFAERTALADSALLSKQGDRVSGTWLVAVERRIPLGGRLVFNGRRCDVGDSSPGERETTLRNWEMERASDMVSFSGRADWSGTSSRSSRDSATECAAPA